jgi:hypothetical protein
MQFSDTESNNESDVIVKGVDEGMAAILDEGMAAIAVEESDKEMAAIPNEGIAAIAVEESDEGMAAVVVEEQNEEAEEFKSARLRIMNKTAILIVDHLVQFKGCCKECHKQEEQEHYQGDKAHLSLYECIPKAPHSIPVEYDVLVREHITELIKQLHTLTTAAEKRELFIGLKTEDRTEEPPHLCLRKDNASNEKIHSWFDIDSIIALVKSLGIVRQGIEWSPTQMQVSDLQSSLHLSNQRVFYMDSHGHEHVIRVPIHQIPHYTLGRFFKADYLSIYLLFPRLYREEQQTSRLRDSDFEIWMNKILLPLLLSVLK